MIKTPPRKHVRNLSFMIVGSLIFTAGYCMFLQPNNLLAGGVFGIAAILNHFFTMIPMAVFVVAMNVPLLLIAWRKLDLRFALYTVLVIALESAMLQFLQPYFPTYTENPLLACIFGGVVVGAGAGLIIRYHGSGGGMEIVSILLKEKIDVSMSTISLLANIVIVTLAAFIFGFDRAMYTMVSLYATAYAFNAVLKGFNSKRNAMIITDKGQEVADVLMNRLYRGVTMIDGEGGYSHAHKDVLFCVVSRFELVALKEIVKQVDPNAFVCINETYDVMGRFPRSGKSNLQK